MAATPPQGPPETTPTSAVPRHRPPRGRLSLSVGRGAPPPNKRAWGLAALLHVVVVVVLLRALTFGHGLEGFWKFGEKAPVEERVTYVEPATRAPDVAPQTPAVVQPVQPPRVAPRPSTGPVVGPGGVPTPAPTVARDSGGGGAGGPPSVGNPNPELRGVQPGFGDPRLWGTARPGLPTQRTGADRLDSIISFAITTAADSLDAIARANGEGGRTPGDWTVRGKDGDKWGWDQVGIRLGKVTIPNALLTLLPMNAQMAMSGNPSNVDREKRLAAARADIMRNSQRAIGEEEFRKLLKELRERKEREHEEKRKAANPPPVAGPKHDDR